MMDTFVDVPDFQFRALRRIRVFDKPDDASYGGICPLWIAVSSRYGIIVCAAGHDKLLSFRSSDVHRLTTTKADINVEVNDIQTKVTTLGFQQPAVLNALACNCSGRLLSVLMDSVMGAFVHLYDMCSFSVDCPEQRGPVYSLRLSADANARTRALEWNPQLDGIFAVATSDGVLSCYSFNIEVASSITMVGTVKHSDSLVTCISWSPKGKQLVVGDTAGHVRQYKPEMVLVRTIPPPTDAPVLKGGPPVALRCVGMSWLATTDFLVAYSPENGRHDVGIALLCMKKDAPPRWTYFDDINYCSEKSIFEQKIKFIRLHDWKLVLCSSHRSSEVAVLGKIGADWKAWCLDDSGRIEMPLDTAHCESFPVGVAIDTSSVLPVKIGEEGGVERPPCPTVLVLSSHGLLLAFNAVSFRADHQNINKPPEALPTKVHGPVVLVQQQNALEAAGTGSSTVLSTTNQTAPVQTKGGILGSLLSSKSTSSAIQQSVSQPQTQPKVEAGTVSTSISQSFVPASVQESSVQQLQQQLQRQQQEQQQQQQQQKQKQLKSQADELTKLREELHKKLILFDEQFFEMRERNDWLQDLKTSTEKQIRQNNDINLDDELLEVEKIRTAVQTWIDGLESLVKETMCSLKEQLENANSTDRDQPHSGRVLDFNSMHRLNKLEDALAKLEQKLVNVEDGLTEVPVRSNKTRSTLILSVEEEQKIAATAKNICKGMASRRRALCELQQRIANLNARYKSLKGGEALNRSFGSRNSSFLNTSFVQQTRHQEDSMKTNARTIAHQRKELLKFLIRRGPAKLSETKTLTLDLHCHEASRDELDTTIARIESRLLEAALTPMKTQTKLVMDVGTQSPDFMLSKGKTGNKPSAASVATTKATGLVASTGTTMTNNKLLTNLLASDNKSLFQSTSSQSAAKPTAVPPAPEVTFSFKSLGTTPTAGTFTNSSAAATTATTTTTTATTTPAATTTTNTTTATAAASTAITTAAATATPAFATSVTGLEPQTKPTIKSTTSDQLSVPTAATFSFKTNLSSPGATGSVCPSSPQGSVFSSSSGKTDDASQEPSLADVSSKSGESASAVDAVKKTSESTPIAHQLTPASTTAVPTSTTGTVNLQSDKTSVPSSVPSILQTSATGTPATAVGAAADTTVSFTFKLPTTTTTAAKQQTTTTASSLAAGLTNVSTNAPATGSTAAATQQSAVDMDAMGDEGMMEAEGTTAAPTSLFSSSMSFGLGSAGPSSNASRNIFGAGLKFGTTSPSSSQSQPSLFGGGAGTKTTSVFGGGTSSVSTSGGGIFSRAVQPNAATSPSSFSFSATSVKPQTTSGLFGSKSTTGGTTFGGTPTFGSKPVFGTPSPLVSAFGQQRTQQPSVPSTSGFSSFAGKSGSLGFGALAASQQQQSTSSVFGGSGFGALAQQPQKGSIFGGGLNSSATPNSSSFSTWR